ncbi:OB-fold putative lipoprotein [Flavihumibacter fluvii]|uniref:OB-fold putative lipoprotein n=1 Tax=Flavihumibacter fluvii TaxID=2838157 RepID=UPI001BDE89D2|nr:OB-fold putative lipoprotein [Flavihumibacter fluvii]ULQ51290.1 OB-fold putative lipoprotein [Flavihumibacter fluvii]
MPNKKRIILLAFLVIGFGGILFAVKEYNRKPEGVEHIQPDFTVSSTEFIREFNEGQAAANQKYLGRAILVTGSINAIDRSDPKIITIVLGDAGSSSGIRCSMDSSFSQENLTVKEQDNISIKGICTGFMPDDMGLGADIILNKCIITENKK